MCDAFFFFFSLVLAYGIQAQSKSTNLADLFETSHLRNGFFPLPSNPGLNSPCPSCKTDTPEFVSFRFVFVQVASREWSVEGEDRNRNSPRTDRVIMGGMDDRR